MRRTTRDVAQVLNCIRQSVDDGLLLLRELEQQQARDGEWAKPSSNPVRVIVKEL